MDKPYNRKRRVQINLKERIQAKTSPIKNEWTNKELNSYLLKYYRHGLFPFALSVTTEILEFQSLGTEALWELRNVKPVHWLNIRDEISALLAIRKELKTTVRKLQSHLSKLDYWNWLENKPNFVRDQIKYPLFFLTTKQINPSMNQHELAKKNYGLDEVFTRIAIELKHFGAEEQLEHELSKPEKQNAPIKSFFSIKRRRGRAMKPYTILTALWAQVITKRGKICWEDIEALIGWFEQKISNTQYASKLKDKADLAEIRKSIRRYKPFITRERETLFNKMFFKRVNINFANDSPYFGVNNLAPGEERPLLFFPDGTTFPEA